MTTLVSGIILDKNSYTAALENMFSYTFKFEEVNIPPGKDSNYIINTKNRLKNYFKNILNKKYIDEAAYKKLISTGFNPGIMYCLANVPKPLKNAVSTF